MTTDAPKKLRNPLFEEWAKALAPSWKKGGGPLGLLRTPPPEGLLAIERLLPEVQETSDEDAWIEPFRARRELVTKYAWAIPTEEALLKIGEHSHNGVVEIGAGTGYWAGLLRELGVDVAAYDEAPHDNFQAKACWSEVHKGGPLYVLKHPERTLMLSWPPYDTPMAALTLRRYKGSTLVYIGEGSGGCTGDAEFHDMLEDEWKEIDGVALPQWPGIHDYLTVYKRKGTS